MGVYGDHLGNIRLSYSDSDNDGKIDVHRNNSDIDGDGDNVHEIREVKDYYPFGMQLNYGTNHPNSLITGRKHNYGYGGKEFSEELNLDTYDFGARNYDPALGRWFVVDALAEHPNQIYKSPYAYAWNNPIFFNDPDGNCPKCPKLPGFLNDAFSYLENTAGSAIRKYGRKAGELLASLNPAVTATNIYKGVTEGQDAFGNNVSNGEVGLEIASSLPFTKALKFADEAVDIIKTIAKNSDDVIEYSLKGADDIVTGSSKLSDKGILELDFQVPKELRGQGVGTAMFDDTIKTFGDKIKGIKGTWVDGDNLSTFQDVLKETGDINKAIFSTPTGKWAQRNGFDQAKITGGYVGENGYEGVEIIFNKSN